MIETNKQANITEKGREFLIIPDAILTGYSLLKINPNCSFYTNFLQ